jgi:hypothetical protein
VHAFTGFGETFTGGFLSGLPLFNRSGVVVGGGKRRGGGILGVGGWGVAWGNLGCSLFFHSWGFFLLYAPSLTVVPRMVADFFGMLNPL